MYFAIYRQYPRGPWRAWPTAFPTHAAADHYAALMARAAGAGQRHYAVIEATIMPTPESSEPPELDTLEILRRYAALMAIINQPTGVL